MPVVARRTRAISSRELSRHTSDLLDEIEAVGSALVVCRYGRPTAMLLPFREGTDVTKLPRLADLAGLGSVEDPEEALRRQDETLDQLDLSEPAAALLREIVEHEGHWRLSDGLQKPAGEGPGGRSVSEVSIAASSLELDGLVDRGPGGTYVPTVLGERYVQRLLDSEA